MATSSIRIERGRPVATSRGPYRFVGQATIADSDGVVIAQLGEDEGVAFSDNALIVGPLASSAGGVDLSFISAGVTGGVLYFVFEKIFPERDVRALTSPAP